MAKQEHVAYKPLPISRSIHWMPVRESHHIVASLQHGNGGRRQLFVQQEILAALNAVGTLRGRAVFGLLLGGLYECPATRVGYLVIHTIGEHAALKGDSPVHALRAAIASIPSRRTSAIMGWYYIAAGIEPASRTANEQLVSDAAGLLRPWQTTLTVTAGPQ